MHEQAWGTQIRQMLNAKLVGLTWRVQWVGEQQEAHDKIVFGGAEYGGLAASIGVTSEIDPSAGQFSHCRHCIAQARSIALCVAGKWWAGTALLAEWQVTTQHCVAMTAESVAESYQQGSVAVASRAVREDQGIAASIIGRVQKAANRRG